MTLFQWIACTALAAAALRELVLWRRARLSLLAWALRTGVWVSALLAVRGPQRVTQLANAVGIGRGADVVLYLFVLAFIAACFGFYSRQQKQERRLSLLAGELALRDARRGPQG